MDFAALDFETANNYLGSVCALGLVIVEKGQIVQTVSRLVRPKELYFDPFNVGIHGITEEVVEYAPEFSDIWPEMAELLEDRIILAHNASFDMNVLKEVLHQYKIECPLYKNACTVKIARKTWPDLCNHRLNTVARHLGIKFKHHDALEDALVCAHIAIKACEEKEADTIEELHRNLKISEASINNQPRRPYFRSGTCPAYPNPKDILPESQDFDQGSPFYKANLVFTGNLKSLSRREAMQRAVNCGACCRNNVSKKTTFLVMGETDYSRVKNGKSKKLQRAEELIEQGSELQILNEEDFLTMLGQTQVSHGKGDSDSLLQLKV